MPNKKQIRYVYAFLVFVCIFLIVFIGVVSALGVPLWWAFPIKSLSGVSLPTLVVHASPQTPKKFNEQITVIVTNSSDQLPVDGAQVLVMEQGMSTITLHTNSTGQVTFPYINVITQVQANMAGIDSSSLIVIPAQPASWVNSDLISLGTAFGSAIFSSLLSFALQKGKGKTKRSSVHKNRKH